LLIRRVPEPVRTIGFAALVALFLDWQFDLPIRGWSLLLVTAIGAVLILLRARRALITVTCLAAFYLASLPLGWTSSQTKSEALIKPRRPVVLHLVLDAQWGPAGFRAAGDTATAEFLSDFYARRGFRLYLGAYSRYLETRFSLGSQVALGGPTSVERGEVGGFRLTANRYFDTLVARGYHLRVFQSSHLDFCAAGVAAKCSTAMGNSLGNIGYLRGSWKPRAMVASRYFLTTRSRAYVSLFGRESLPMRRSSAGRAVDVLEAVKASIAAGEADAYFVHVLIPHSPFEVDARCQGYADIDRRVAPGGTETRDPHGDLAAYGLQSRCGHQMLAELLATLDSTVGRDQAIVVVQGDHGAKLISLPSRPSDYSRTSSTSITRPCLRFGFPPRGRRLIRARSRSRISSGASWPAASRTRMSTPRRRTSLPQPVPRTVTRSGSSGRPIYPGSRS
jgi:hypothetical protein